MRDCVSGHDERRTRVGAGLERGVVELVSHAELGPRGEWCDDGRVRAERPLPDVFGVLLAPVSERAIVVAHGDAEHAARQLPPRPEEARQRPRRLTEAAAEEPAELRARAEEVEIEIAQTSVRKRHADVRIEQRPERQRDDALRGARCKHACRGTRRRGVRRTRRGLRRDDISIALRGVTQHHAHSTRGQPRVGHRSRQRSPRAAASQPRGGSGSVAPPPGKSESCSTARAATPPRRPPARARTRRAAHSTRWRRASRSASLPSAPARTRPTRSTRGR